MYRRATEGEKDSCAYGSEHFMVVLVYLFPQRNKTLQDVVFLFVCFFS